MGRETKMDTGSFLKCCTARALEVGLLRGTMNPQGGKPFLKFSSVVFLLLHTDVTVAEFGSNYLSVMDEHHYLPGETER